MLDVTLSTSFVPGANVKGRVSGANWVFLRPALTAGRVICVGVPEASTLATLARFSRTVLVVASNVRLAALSTAGDLPTSFRNVQFCAVGDLAGMLEERSADVLVCVGWRSPWRVRRDPQLRHALTRALKHGALVYYEHLGAFDPLRSMPLLHHDPADRDVQRFRLTPLGGEMETAIPALDPDMARYFRENRLSAEPSTTRVLRRVAKRAREWVAPRHAPALADPSGTMPTSSAKNGAGVGRVGARRWMAQANGHLRARRPWFDNLVDRYGVLLGAPATAASINPPQYLRAVAAQSGIRLEGFRWGLSARGNYSSRKLVFYLADGAATDVTPPRYVAKMVRDAVFNPRLENEHRALSLLCRQEAIDKDTVPRPVFFGHHAGLAILGQTVVHGVPFVRQTTASADCPLFQAALDWFTALAAGTAHSHSTAATGEAATTFAWLLARFHELYLSSAEEQSFLSDQVAVLIRGAEALPLTFQHGDPGLWNMLVTPAAKVALLDWEAAEPHGMPLWDLFYFLRSYAVIAARLGGGRNSLDGIAAQLLCDTPFSRKVTEASHLYCKRTGVPEAMIEPLFYSCWMHRAIKEASRLTPERLGEGHYINLIRLTIARRQVPALRRLFAR